MLRDLPRKTKRMVACLTTCAALLLIWPESGNAARDGAAAPATQSDYELIVFEVDGCVYCDVFRRDVLPYYSASQTSRKAPLRFVNLTHSDESRMRLAGAITIAPTIVLMSKGREVNRITGYTGPATFVQLVGSMLGLTD